MLDISLREPDVLRRLRDETAKHPMAIMQISPEQGQLMQMLVRMLGAKNCIEVGGLYRLLIFGGGFGAACGRADRRVRYF